MKNVKVDINFGLGGILQKGNKALIWYNGNMGTTMAKVDEMTEHYLGRTVEELKDQFEVVEEDGSPTYSYGLTLKMPRGVLITQFTKEL